MSSRSARRSTTRTSPVTSARTFYTKASRCWRCARDPRRVTIPELAAIERLTEIAAPLVSVERLAVVETLPIHAFHFGAADRALPVLLVTGGVHGLERIGSDVAIAFLTSLYARLP